MACQLLKLRIIKLSHLNKRHIYQYRYFVWNFKGYRFSKRSKNINTNGFDCVGSVSSMQNYSTTCTMVVSWQWRQNERYGVSNHRRLECLLSHLFRRRSKKTSKHRVTGLCEGTSPVTGEFPAQSPSNGKIISIWRHHEMGENTNIPVFTQHKSALQGWSRMARVILRTCFKLNFILSHV